MFKKISFILIISGFIFLGLRSTVSAQKYYGKEKALSQASAEETGESQTLPSREQLKDLGMANKEILRKLDLVLSNQEKILKELETVKIRASRH